MEGFRWGQGPAASAGPRATEEGARGRKGLVNAAHATAKERWCAEAPAAQKKGAFNVPFGGAADIEGDQTSAAEEPAGQATASTTEYRRRARARKLQPSRTSAGRPA